MVPGFVRNFCHITWFNLLDFSSEFVWWGVAFWNWCSITIFGSMKLMFNCKTLIPNFKDWFFLHIRLAQVCYFVLCLFPFLCFCSNRMSQLMKLFKGLEGALVLVKNLTYWILILNVLSYLCIQFYSTKFNTYSFGHLLQDVKDDTKSFCSVEFKLVPKKGYKSA